MTESDEMKNKIEIHKVINVLMFLILILILVILYLFFNAIKANENISQEKEAAADTEDISSAREKSPTESQLLPETSLYYALTSTDLYDSPKIEGNIIGHLYQHEPVRITEESNGWGKVQLNGGIYGYVPMYQLSREILKEVDETETHWEYQRTGLDIQINKYSEDGIVYWVADVYMENPDADLNTAWAGGSYEASYGERAKTSLLASDHDAIFAINGDSAGARRFGSDYENPIIIRNGVLYHEDERDIGDMCALLKSGELKIFSPGDLGSGEEMVKSGVTDTWWFDCALIIDGEIPDSLIEVEASLDKAPYTAIGQKDTNNFIFIVVDGRGSNGSEGVTYTGMARLMQKYGAVTAYELDGGGSSTIWFDGMVLNKPSDGSQRAVSDIIYVRK